MAIVKTKSKKSKLVLLIAAVLVLHAAVVAGSIKAYNIYESREEERLVKDYMKSGVIDEDKFAGTVFEYDLEYTLKNGETKDFSGKEVYYWDGCKLVSVSDFMKGLG